MITRAAPSGRATLAHLLHEARMTRLELEYRGYLSTLLAAGLIARFDYEPERLRIAGDFASTYTPDFRIVRPDGTVEFHEVKGWWREDGRLKIKVAAAQHPYVFRAVTRARAGTWAWETFTAGAGDWKP